LFPYPWSAPMDMHDFRHGKEHDASSSESDGDDDDTGHNLVAAAAPAVAPTAVDAAERRVDAAEKRATGNQLFKNGDLEAACEAYASALEALLYNTEPDLSAMSAVLCNRSAALVRLDRGEDAVRDATDAVQFDPRQVKPYYRLATALDSLGRHREVVDVCDEALELAPESEQLEALRLGAFEALGFRTRDEQGHDLAAGTTMH